MTKQLQHLFALSEKGAKDLVKAVIWCLVCNLSLMFPVGAVLFTVQHLLDNMENNGSSMDGFWIYTGFGIAVLILLFILHWFQYASLYLATYKESASRRISLAETLRRLPLSFFGNRDLSDLTSTMIADCSSLDQMFFPLCAAVVRIHFLYSYHRRCHVLLLLEDGAGCIVGNTGGGSAHSWKPEDPGRLWYKEYFKQAGGGRLHPGRAGNHTGY